MYARNKIGVSFAGTTKTKNPLVQSNCDLNGRFKFRKKKPEEAVIIGYN